MSLSLPPFHQGPALPCRAARPRLRGAQRPVAAAGQPAAQHLDACGLAWAGGPAASGVGLDLGLGLSRRRRSSARSPRRQPRRRGQRRVRPGSSSGSSSAAGDGRGGAPRGCGQLRRAVRAVRVARREWPVRRRRTPVGGGAGLVAGRMSAWWPRGADETKGHKDALRPRWAQGPAAAGWRAARRGEQRGASRLLQAGRRRRRAMAAGALAGSGCPAGERDG
jgi:hypothetical protein